MKWLADQRAGYFGWTPSLEGPPQFRHRARVDLDAAKSAVGDILGRFWTVLDWPSAPPFSGGVLDAWPSRLADGLAVCRKEWAAIQWMLQSEAEEKAKKGSANG